MAKAKKATAKKTTSKPEIKAAVTKNTKKTVTKKPIVKTTSKPKNTKRTVKKTTNVLRTTKKELYFYLENGHVLKNVKELADELETMNSEMYSHHVNNEKNDFANWIEHVFKDISLANKVKNAKNKDFVRLEIYKHLLEVK